VQRKNVKKGYVSSVLPSMRTPRSLAARLDGLILNEAPEDLDGISAGALQPLPTVANELLDDVDGGVVSNISNAYVPLEDVDGGAGSPSGSDYEDNLSGVDGGAKPREGIVDPDGNVVH
jgi:hypothetical protein